MSDPRNPAEKPRRRRLYQEQPDAEAAPPPAASESGKTASKVAKTRGKAAGTVSRSSAERTAEANDPGAAAAPAPAPAPATTVPAEPVAREGEFIAAAEPVAIAATLTAVKVPPEPLHASPMLCRLKAKQAVRDHALLSGGAMVIPVPLLDMAAEAAIQIRMVKRLAEIYGVDFGEERAKTLVVAALGGFSAGWAAGSLLRYASFATYFTNFWPSAMLSAAITYAVGQVFIHHFDSGGGLHDLSPESAAAILKEKAKNLRRRKPGAAEAAA